MELSYAFPLEEGLVLQRIQPCSVPYKLRTWLHDKENDEAGPAQDSYVMVTRLEHSLPKLAVQLDKRMLEWSLPSSGRDKEGNAAVTGGSIDFFVQGSPTSLAIIDTCVELILLDGGTADFDLYTLYGKDGLEGTVLEASVDEGIAKVREEEHAEKKLFEAALEEGFDLRLELGKLNGRLYITSIVHYSANVRQHRWIEQALSLCMVSLLVYTSRKFTSPTIPLYLPPPRLERK